MRKLWHLASTGNHQGLVTCAETGANIAVTYDRANAPLIAGAPALFNAAKDFLAELDSEGDFENWERVKRELRQTMADIENAEREESEA